MTRQGRIAFAVWLVLIAVCIALVSRAHFTADLSAFLPRAPTQEQQLLVDQLKSGIASRLLLVGVEGGSAAQRAQASRALAQHLRRDPQFSHIANGESVGLERDRQLVFEHRYALSPAVNPERFSVDGLNAALTDSIDQLASSVGLVSKQLLPRDPTGELLQILDRLDGESLPRMDDGVWVSADGQRVLLLARTRADGSDIDAQARAMQTIRAQFNKAQFNQIQPSPGAQPGLKLLLSGPGTFAVESRDTIKSEVTLLSGIGAFIIVALLLAVYRSPTALLLGLLPVLSGALAGVAAVSLGFGIVHGVTLGFGTALIGEAVDYSIYLLMQSERAKNAAGQAVAGLNQAAWVKNFWPTIRIGVLTSIFGFVSLLFSGFSGLAQLGLYAIAGLVTAAAVTRYVLPHLLPANLQIRDVSAFGLRLQAWLPRLNSLRWPLVGVFVAALAVLTVQRDTLWSHALSSLSPVPDAAQKLDAAMRADLGAPDVSTMVVVTASSAEAALVASERVSLALQSLVDRGVIAGFETPSRYLPSVATQRQRRASLPPDDVLRQRFQAALAGLPLRADRFEGFFSDIAIARAQAPLTRADLEGTSLAQGVDAMLVKAEGRWTALLPLRASLANNHQVDAVAVRAALATTGLQNVYFVDVGVESARLYSGYLREAILLSLLGLLAIVGLLFVVTRSLWRVLRICLPLAMSVAVVTAGLVLVGQQLTILHLVGMLLVVAVGSNYALFFDRGVVEGNIAPRTLASLALAVTTTVIGFGILGFSSVPVLNAMGLMVGPGAICALLFSAILSQTHDAA